jgi:hypothetical protein
MKNNAENMVVVGFVKDIIPQTNLGRSRGQFDPCWPRGDRGNVVRVVAAKLNEPSDKDKKFEDVVKEAEQARCWCWCWFTDETANHANHTKAKENPFRVLSVVRGYDS